MSFEVAALHATLGVRTEGFAEASRFTQQLSAAQEALERSSGAASAQVQILRNELEDSVNTLKQFSNVTEFNNELLKGFGQTTQTLGTALAAARAEADKATAAFEQHQQSIKAAQNEYQALKDEATAVSKEHGAFSEEARQAQASVIAANQAIREQVAQLGALRAAANSASQELHNLEVAEALVVDDTVFAAGQLQQAANVERATLRVNRALGSTARVQKSVQRETKLSQTTLSGLVSAMRTGNIGSSILAQGMQFLSSRMGLLAVGIGGVAIALGTAAVKMGVTAAALNRLNPQFLDLAENIGHIEGMDLTQVTEQLQLISNRLSSFGASSADEGAEAIARLGQQLAALRPGADDAGVAIQAIQRAIEQISGEGLRDFGVDVAALEAELTRLADAGYGEAAQRAAIFAAVQGTVLNNSEEIAAQLSRESSDWKSVGTEMKKTFDAVAGSAQVRNSVESLVTSFKSLTVVLKPVLQAVGFLVGLFSVALSGAIKTAQLALAGIMRAFSFIVRAGAALPGALGDSFKALADSTLGYAKELEAAAFNTKELGGATRVSRDELFQFGQAADQATSRLQAFNDKIQGGFSIVGSIRQIGDAWDDMQANLSPATTLDFIESIDQAMGFLAEHGTQSLGVLRERIQAFLDAGIINQGQYDQLVSGLDAVMSVAGPLQDEVRRVEDALGETASQGATTAGVNNTQLSPSIAGIGTAADVSAGQVGNLNAALASIPATVSTSFVLSGTSVSGVGLAPGAALPTMPSTASTTGQRRGRGQTPTRFAGEHTSPEAMRQFTPPRRVPDFQRVADTFRAPSTAKASGGGGGGGGSMASIEQIQEFFRQMNQAIKIGVNNNIRFGTAGNTIPTGGIGEFLNTKGGDLIQTINLRGVWDFADPAAKREVVRQLRELLAELSREDA